MEKLLEQEAMMEENQKVRVCWVRRRRRVKPIVRLPPHHPDSLDQLRLRLQGDYPPSPHLLPPPAESHHIHSDSALPSPLRSN